MVRKNFWRENFLGEKKKLVEKFFGEKKKFWREKIVILFLEPTFFEEERRKDPTVLVWRNPLFGREDVKFTRKVRASSTSLVEGRGVMERLKVLKKLGINGQKKAHTTTPTISKEVLMADPNVNFF